MFWKAICDNLGTIIGVAGSLLGAVIGWWLNNISRRGKLTAYVDNGITLNKVETYNVENSNSKANLKVDKLILELTDYGTAFSNVCLTAEEFL